jgi:vanillate/4-hydroxybenzoate decarboxylase subunit C
MPLLHEDLRAFLATLEREKQLLHISEEVRLEPDLGAIACAVNRLGDTAPALLVERLHGYCGKSIALNVHGSWPNHALMLGLPKDTPLREQFFEFARRWDRFPVAVDRRTEAPWQEHVIEGDAIDLFSILPLFRMNAYDGGCFIDKACVVTRDPSDSGNFSKQNVGIYRMQAKGKARLGLQPVPQHDAGLHLRIAEENGEDLPIAISIGNEPVITMVAGMPIGYDQSEYEMAGAIDGASYPIVAAGNGLDVPWGSEVVIEGVVLAGKREIEGPFGEFTGHYSGGRRAPVIRVDRISHRTNPIFEHLYIGVPWTELDYLTGINTCVPLYRQLKLDFPEVTAVNAMYTHGFVAIISTKQRYGGFAKAVGLRAMSTPHGLGYLKTVILVDETVDPFNLPQVMWAIATKFHPAHDVVIVPDASVVSLDPGSAPPGMTHKMIIDATTPIAPDSRGRYSQVVADPSGTAEWEVRLRDILKGSGHV